MAFTLQIGGTDFSSYPAADGFQWERNDVDAPNSGRDLSGKMRRKIVARKDKIQVTCRDLKPAELTTLINALSSTNVSVTYTVPGTSSTRTATFYNSQKKAGIVMDLGTIMLYSGVQFDLVEV